MKNETKFTDMQSSGRRPMKQELLVR